MTLALCAPSLPVFVMEYYRDTLWKGAVLFLFSLVSIFFYFKIRTVSGAGLMLRVEPL